MALIAGGIVLATPGGGILPFSQLQIVAIALAILAPTFVLARLCLARASAAPTHR
jgi:hypothetical protein